MMTVSNTTRFNQVVSDFFRQFSNDTPPNGDLFLEKLDQAIKLIRQHPELFVTEKHGVRHVRLGDALGIALEYVFIPQKKEILLQTLHPYGV